MDGNARPRAEDIDMGRGEARIGGDQPKFARLLDPNARGAQLRPNPDFSVAVDQITPFTGNPYRPFEFYLPSLSLGYLVERRHKRDLRLASAQGATAIATSQLADQERSLLFDLRTAFVQVLQQKAVCRPL